MTVGVGSREALADWEPQPASSDSTGPDCDKLLQVELHIVVAGFVGAGGRKVAVVAESRHVA